MKQLAVTSSPHIRSRWIASSIMRHVIIALIPTAVMGVWIQGIRALWILIIAMVSCVVTESFYTKRAAVNGAEAVTGLLLGLSLPASVPYWIPAVGGIFAVLVVKHLCGGLGRNVFNPVLAARAFLFLLWPLYLTSVPSFTADGLTTATPLHEMQIPAIPEESLGRMFFGTIGGCIGETSKAALILGGVYLLWKGVVRPHIPVAYLSVVAVLTLLFSRDQQPFLWMAYQLMSGSLILGALYMATDYVTSPVTPGGRILFGAGCGVLTVVFRYFGLYPEGVTYAILCMNPFSWSLDRWLAPRVFGHKKRRSFSERKEKGEAHG